MSSRNSWRRSASSWEIRSVVIARKGGGRRYRQYVETSDQSNEVGLRCDHEGGRLRFQHNMLFMSCSVACSGLCLHVSSDGFPQEEKRILHAYILVHCSQCLIRLWTSAFLIPLKLLSPSRQVSAFRVGEYFKEWPSQTRRRSGGHRHLQWLFILMLCFYECVENFFEDGVIISIER